ncbi:MAG TPA: FG-GAP-like repeat-containing protein [Terriglobales bacterium]|nr:FG-GAP-like repeat-containing protein [Terriglobales bacterium]
MKPIVSSLAAVIIAAITILPAGSQNKTKERVEPKRVAGSQSAAQQSARNLGKAYYEQGQYAQAQGEFGRIVATGQALATDYLDLGLAQMQLGRYDQALGSFTTARQKDPKLTAVNYNLGILYKREGRDPDAEAALKEVTVEDPGDPAAWFNLGAVRMNQHKLAPALDAFQHVDNMGFDAAQNFYVTSLFRSFTVLERLKRQPEAQKCLARYQKYRGRVPGISVQATALEAGKYGTAVVPPPSLVPKRNAPLPKILFAEFGHELSSAPPQPLPEAPAAIAASDYSLEYARQHLLSLFGTSVAVGDYDGDGRPDVYIVNPAGTNRLLQQKPDGTFADVTEKAGVAGRGGSVSATFADYDNSGRLSLIVAGLGGVRVYHNQGDGTFADRTIAAHLEGTAGEVATQALFFDADNDGLLDLFVSVYTDLAHPPQQASFTFPQDFTGAASHLYRNNGDGTFTDITRAAGLGALGRARGALFANFTDAPFADLLVLRDDGPPLLYKNRGGARFSPRRESSLQVAATQAQAADFNHDGKFDMVLWTPSGPQVLLNRGNANFVALKGSPLIRAARANFAARGTVADFDGDGFDDLLAADAQGKWHLLLNRGGVFREAPLSLSSSTVAYSSIVPAWLRNPGELDLLATGGGAGLELQRRRSPSPHWVEIALAGEKSNQKGIGAVVEVKAGNFYHKLMVTHSPLRVFAGTLPRVDVVRVTWPNAIVQNALNVATDKTLRVRESERLASSCPFLYAWDGQKFTFVTDVLGAAPLGELQPDGSLAQPNPLEFVRLPHTLQPRNGRYLLRFTDEMREVDYFDRIKLLAVDHAAGQEIYANEIYGSVPQHATLFAVRDQHAPVSAVDDEGRDVLPLLLGADGRYVGGFQRRRVPGLASLHTLTLDLGPFAKTEHLALWLQGWVLWPDSNSARALASQKTKLVGPYLQVRDTHGQWVRVVPDMGLPSGTNRAIRVDLTGKFLSADHHVRITTNLCVYWDRIFFTTDDRPVRPTGEEPLLSASLHYRGFSTPHPDPAQVRPDEVNYAELDAAAPWDPAPGTYTRYGNVRPLVSRTDDELVVMAPGDELSVSFDANALPPLRQAWQRDFFLYLAGWAKDNEPNTMAGESSDPLPFAAMPGYPNTGPAPHRDAAYRAYFRRYQTRRRYRLIPPLAPAE